MVLQHFHEQRDSFCFVRLSSWSDTYGDGNTAMFGYPKPIKYYVVKAVNMGVVFEHKKYANHVMLKITTFGKPLIMYQPVSWIHNNVIFKLDEYEGMEELTTEDYIEWEVNFEDEENSVNAVSPELGDLVSPGDSESENSGNDSLYEEQRPPKRSRKVQSDDSDSMDDLEEDRSSISSSDSDESDVGGFRETQYSQANKSKRVFNRGHATSGIAKYIDYTPFELVNSMLRPLCELYSDCMDVDENEKNVAVDELRMYHGVWMYIDLVKLHSLRSYWGNNSLFESKVKYFKLMTYERFCYIRSHIKAYYPDDLDLPRLDKKVYRAWELLKRHFNLLVPYPGEHLSMDEAMAGCAVSRNPIYVSVLRKPLEGFRFFVLVDYETKVVINFNLDNKMDNAMNCAQYPYGFVGHQVIKLLDGSIRGGTGRVIYCDNYYSSIPLCTYLLRNDYYMVGTMNTKKQMPNCIRLPGKKPSKVNPRGMLKMAKNESNINLYGWMDNGACYFIDSAYGPDAPHNIARRPRRSQTRINLQVPLAIVMYNQKMGGVDQKDQVDANIHQDQSFRVSKWTTRMFEVLFRMLLGNAYNVYRYLHPNEYTSSEFCENVMTSLLSDATRAVQRVIFMLSKFE